MRASQAHARVLHKAGLLSDADLDRHARRAGRASPPTSPVGAFVPADVRRGRARRARARPDRAGRHRGRRASCGPAVRRNDQVATLFRMWLRDAVRRGRGGRARRRRRARHPGRRHPDAVMPGKTHLQAAQPVLLAHHLLAHAHPLLRDVRASADFDRRAAVSPYGSGALAGSSLGLDPEADRARNWGSTAPRRTRSTPPSSRDFAAEAAFVLAMIGVDLSPDGRGGHHLEHTGVRLHHARRRVVDRIVDHAAEEEPGRLRADPRQGGAADRQPHRPARDAEGAAAGVQPGPAGGQGAGVRLGGATRAAAARDRRTGRAP